jgi:hypothetical protein
MPYLIESAKRWADKGSSGGHLILITSIGAQLLFPTASDYQASKHAINRLCEFVNVDHGQDGIKCFSVAPGGVATDLARNMPEDYYSYLTDTPELPAGFIVWLASGRADWATGRFLSVNWDVEELLRRNLTTRQGWVANNELQQGIGLPMERASDARMAAVKRPGMGSCDEMVSPRFTKRRLCARMENKVYPSTGNERRPP